MKTPAWACARVACILLLALGISACGRDDDGVEAIFGHWRAERVRMMSLSLPVSPEFIIDKNAIEAIGADLRIPLQGIRREGNEFIVELPAGVGLSLYIESADRMYVDIPLAGKIYYRRIHDAEAVKAAPPASAPAVAAASDNPAVTAQPAAAQAVAQPAAQPVTPPPLAAPASSAGQMTMPAMRQAAENALAQGRLVEARALLAEAKKLQPEEAMLDYDLAILSLKQADNESAIHHLANAFQHGFRSISQLESDADFMRLRADVRYGALIARYK